MKWEVCDYFRKLGRETNFADLEFFSDEHSDRFDRVNYWIRERGPEDWKCEGEQAVKCAEFWQAMEAALDRLPTRVAQVFIMREMDGVPSREVCQVLEISETNLWVMLPRAPRILLRIRATDSPLWITSTPIFDPRDELLFSYWTRIRFSTG
jgi:RNA polymerase sigma-70 factor, ECF subfamily